MTETLGSLEERLTEAAKALQEAESRESMARSDTTDCRNALNTIQKAFDARVAELKKAAPRDTDWSRSGLTAMGRICATRIEQ